MQRPDGAMIWWALILSNLFLALLLTLVLKWSGAKGYLDGLKTGGLFGLLMSVAMGLSYYSMSTMYNNFTGLIVDVVVAAALLAVVGMVIVLLWGKK